MFFDALKGTWAEQEGFFYRCLECERTVRTDPAISALSAGIALEHLLRILLDKNGINIPDNIDELRAVGLEMLTDRIEKCLQEGFISPFQSELMHKIRKRRNIAAFDEHGTDVRGATETFENLYRLAVSIVKQIPPDEVRLTEDEENLEDWLTIGDYEVVEIINQDDKSEDKIPTYKCVLSADEHIYAIIRRYKKDSDDYASQSRSIHEIQLLKINYANLSHKPVDAEEIHVSSNCEYRYIKYSTAKDTILLSQAVEFKKMRLTSSNVLQIMENVVDILYSLTDIGNGVSLHHHGLNPKSIFITPNKRGYNVQIGNFECSKVIDGDNITETATVFDRQQIERMGKSVYMPPEVRDGSILNITDPDREQIDVYSCAVILLYLSYKVTPHIDRFEAWLDKLAPYFSEELINTTKDILTSPYGSRPTLNEYLKAIRKEVALNE